MKLALYSDLHLEFSSHWQPPSLDADVIILAGDIGHKDRGIEWARRTFPHNRIIFVSGNHELYGGSLLDLDLMRETANRTNVDFLENDCIEIDGIRFLGGVLWSNFKLYGDGIQQAIAMRAARESIRDYTSILGRDGKYIDPQETVRLHSKAVAFLDTELAKPFNGKTVVVTHFSPHRKAIESRFEGRPVTSFFTTDMSWLMEKYPIDLWAFGHTHHNIDFTTQDGCRLISNQRGYEQEIATRSNGFRANLLIELGRPTITE